MAGKIGPPPPSTETRAKLPLLLSAEFRWLYVAALAFLLLIAATLLVSGGVNVWLWTVRRLFPYEDRGSLTSGILYLLGGLLALLVAVGVRQVRRYFLRVHELTIAQIKNVEFSKISETDFEQIDRIRELREEKARVDFL